MPVVDVSVWATPHTSRLRAVHRGLSSAAYDTLDELLDIGMDAIRSAMPHDSYDSSSHHHDGARPPLEDNLQGEHDAYHIDIWIDSVNAMSLDQGSAPHEIHGNPNLRFFWESAGKPFKGPMVNHPGTDAYHFMDAGFDAIDAAAEEAMARHYSL